MFFFERVPTYATRYINPLEAEGPCNFIKLADLGCFMAPGLILCLNGTMIQLLEMLKDDALCHTRSDHPIPYPSIHKPQIVG